MMAESSHEMASRPRIVPPQPTQQQQVLPSPMGSPVAGGSPTPSPSPSPSPVDSSVINDSLFVDEEEEALLSMRTRCCSSVACEGWCLQFTPVGPFERSLEYSWRVAITCLLSLACATYTPISSVIVAPFLCPVLAMMSCTPSLGSTISISWQVTKGTSYASIFGYICMLCGVGYDNNSRVATAILLILFTMWAKYFISPSALTAKKLAVGLLATILITQLNTANLDPLFSWQLLATSCLGSACAIVGGLLPFPKPALKEAEQRWAHALLQTTHLFKLALRGFACASTSEVQARMIHERICATMEHLVVNRNDLAKRLREADDEWPVVFYRVCCGSWNNYALKRFHQHLETLDHLIRYLRCMAVSLSTLPYNDFHNACLAYLRPDLLAVAHSFEAWARCVADTGRLVHRDQHLNPVLATYSADIARLMERYVECRMHTYFDDRGALRKNPFSLTDLTVPAGVSSGPTTPVSDVTANPTPPSSVAAPPLARDNSHSRVVFHEDVELADESAPAPTPKSWATSAPKVEPAASAAHPPSVFSPAGSGLGLGEWANLTWTSEDVISLNYFIFQLNEFTRRSLKLRREPEADSDNSAEAVVDANSPSSGVLSPEPDPIAVYHLDWSRAPQFAWDATVAYVRQWFAELFALWRWDRRQAIEASKLALAIFLTALNELVPRDWPAIYPRTSHGWWASVTVAFTMADSLGGHVSSMVLRVLGTFVGAIVGYFLVEIVEGSVVALVLLLTLWGGLTSYGRQSPTSGYAHLVAGFSAVVVAVGSDPTVSGSVTALAFVRIQETLIGVLVGMVVHNAILPEHASTLLHREIIQAVETIAHAFEHSFGKYLNWSSKVEHDAVADESGELRINIESRSGAEHALMPSPAAAFDAASSEHRRITFTSHTIGGLPSITPAMLAALDLNPAHSFQVLGPKIFASFDKQASLCASATLEPTLWFAPFPQIAYERIITAQRNTALYLYCMDLALQRIAQSGSRYLMPDLDQHFARLKAKVMQSLEQVARSLRTYGQDFELGEDKEAHHEHNQPMLTERDRRPISARTRARAHSSAVQNDALLSLNSSLQQLEARYKIWIDQCVLAKRDQLRRSREAASAAALAKEQQAAEPPNGRQLGFVVSLAPLKSRLPLVDDGLMPIPLDTPKQRKRRTKGRRASSLDLTATARVDAADADADAEPTGSAPVTRGDATPAAKVTSAATAAVSAPPNEVSPPMNFRALCFAGAHAGVGPESASVSVMSPRHLHHLPDAAHHVHVHHATPLNLDHMDVVFTRSIDVLALNTFLFSTRGLIREIVSLSQSVRVLLHMRAPGPYEQPF